MVTEGWLWLFGFYFITLILMPLPDESLFIKIGMIIRGFWPLPGHGMELVCNPLAVFGFCWGDGGGVAGTY